MFLYSYFWFRQPPSLALFVLPRTFVPISTFLLSCSAGRGGAHGPPPEMQVSLASLQAPKLGRAPGIPDEQFAWDSREFLRKKCIGKQVQFYELHTAVLYSGCRAVRSAQFAENTE